MAKDEAKTGSAATLHGVINREEARGRTITDVREQEGGELALLGVFGGHAGDKSRLWPEGHHKCHHRGFRSVDGEREEERCGGFAQSMSYNIRVPYNRDAGHRVLHI